ncbi:MAG: caspase family protein, partial [Akkermansiaceae bacterium]|nr:caspase family protein [Akkermansiaceae bacterium]
LQWAVTDSFRALLIGIDAYPAPDMQLEGCRNDVFLVSELLQELGLPAGSVRVLLDSRATAAAIRERMEWLLEGVGEDDERFLFFSGHGAQIPGYGLGEVVDRRDEVLVPWDFDWTRQNAIHDDGFYELYSNLPYSSRFTAVFDCCHAGGMTRDGAMRVRGLNPPDDIRHRVMAWHYDDRSKRKDPDEWDLRELELPANQIYRHINQLPPPGRSGSGSAYCSTHRLGQAMTLREYGPGGRDRFRKLAKSRGHRGPYMPTLWYACQEREFAMEYRQGSASYGAFTWSFVRLVREIRKQQEIRSASQIEKHLQSRVQAINPSQMPHLIAPSAVRKKPPSWILPH